ncbi:aminopeptidase N [Solicola gregarius]|uniref:Aminopeptidase N n=1 Tax=Solicola gregarius TaxID=2908642 RepID=A0AA46TH82_9ACTN|nr:aminopeptidase N [Solicola gregarius]UYM05133.1 aminopeptidase N [Solicola gregarius]
MANLTVEEARARADLITVQAYDVRLDLDQGPETFDSRTTIRFESAADCETFVELSPVEVHELTLDGAPLDRQAHADGRLPLRLTAGTHELIAHTTMAYSNDGEGIHRAVDPVDGEPYLHAMSFLDAAPRIFCCFDQPDLKAPYTMAVRAPLHWTVVGNARAERDGEGRWRFEETKPLSTYFVTLVAGPYHVRTREHDGIRLGLLARQSLAPHLDKDADELFTVTAQCFDAYHEMFGIRYPFGDYYQCFVPEFNAGAMENPGCVTFRDDMIFRSRVTGAERGGRARVIAHEMAHQWFGDLVTMQWWDDLWLNESFAEYMAYRVCDAATEFTDSWVDFAGVRKPWGLLADQRPSTHPVAGNGAPDGASALADFDGISYAKGASVLKQLAAHLGDEVFLGGVRAHLTRHAFGNATLHDLFGAWRDAGATDLDEWARAWLRTAGADVIRFDRRNITVESPDGTVRPHTFSVGTLGAGDDVVTTQVALRGGSQQVESGADELILLDVHDETWARFRHDPQTVSGLVDAWPRITDPVTRASVWLGLRDSVDDADIDTGLAVSLVESAIPHETEDITVQALAGWSRRSLLDRYLSDPRTARQRLSGAYGLRLDSAPPGSALQLAAARGFVTLTSDADLLQRWISGEAPHGLAIDDELRWTVVTQLARWGGVDVDAIARELERDPSSSGRIHAIRARAALPDPDAKTAAWHDLTNDTGLSNYEIYATAEGFWWPEQTALHAPYVERYFAEFPATQGFRSGWVVGESARLAFPSVAVEARTLTLADETLTRTDLRPGLRRSIADAAADLAGALEVRKRARDS